MLTAAYLCACSVATRPTEPVHVILIGDSTMARVTGYGDALCARFNAATKCDNLARGGRSSKSYRGEGLWDAALARIEDPGYRTFVLIQFGHNDQPGKAERSTTLPEFRANMQRYLDDIRAAGAIGVLVTPLARRSFRDNVLLDDLGPWAEATIEVASASKTPLLDLHRDSMQAIAAMGAVDALSLAELPPPDHALAAASTGTTVSVDKPIASVPNVHMPAFDYTHLGPKGAELFSAIVAGEIRESVPELGDSLR